MSYIDIAYKVESGRGGYFFKLLLTILHDLVQSSIGSANGVLSHLHLWMIRSNTKSHEAVRHRQLLVHVNNSTLDFVQQTIRSVEAGGA